MRYMYTWEGVPNTVSDYHKKSSNYNQHVQLMCKEPCNDYTPPPHTHAHTHTRARTHTHTHAHAHAHTHTHTLKRTHCMPLCVPVRIPVFCSCHLMKSGFEGQFLCLLQLTQITELFTWYVHCVPVLL